MYERFGSAKASVGLGVVVAAVTYPIGVYFGEMVLVTWLVGWFTYLVFAMATDVINCAAETTHELRKVRELLEAKK